MKPVQFQVYLISTLLVIGAALPSFAYAKKRKKRAPSPVEIVRQVKLTTDCEKSVISRLEPDVALSVIARDLGIQFPMDKVKTKLQLLTGDLSFKDGFKLTERASVRNRALSRKLIFNFLGKLGLNPVYEDFGNGMNVVAELTGMDYPDEVLELGAHYDSAGESVPGADDNGSGLALVLQMAEEFVKTKPKRTIRFVFYDLEEKGLVGSRAHVREVKKDPRLFLGAIVIDMIGFLPKEAKDLLAVAEIGSEPREGATDRESRWRRSLHQLAQAMFFQYERYKDARRLVLSPERETAKPGTGDHGSYWDADLPAIFIAAPYEGDYVNPENHSKDDTIANMNWEYYTEVSRFVVEAAAWIAGAQIGPENADSAQNQPKKDILLSMGPDLIGPRIERQEDLIAVPSYGFKAPSADDKIFEEIEDTIKASLTTMDENGLVELWEAASGPAVMLVNDPARIATVLLPSGKSWNIRNQAVIDFVAGEIKIAGGVLAKTGTIDPIFLGKGTKDEIRALAKKERPLGARPGPAVRKPAYVLNMEIPDSFLSPQTLKRVREALLGKTETFKKKHETAKANFKPFSLEDESWYYGGGWD